MILLIIFGCLFAWCVTGSLWVGAAKGADIGTYQANDGWMDWWCCLCWPFVALLVITNAVEKNVERQIREQEIEYDRARSAADRALREAGMD